MTGGRRGPCRSRPPMSRDRLGCGPQTKRRGLSCCDFTTAFCGMRSRPQASMSAQRLAIRSQRVSGVARPRAARPHGVHMGGPRSAKVTNSARWSTRRPGRGGGPRRPGLDHRPGANDGRPRGTGSRVPSTPQRQRTNGAVPDRSRRFTPARVVDPWLSNLPERLDSLVAKTMCPRSDDCCEVTGW